MSMALREVPGRRHANLAEQILEETTYSPVNAGNALVQISRTLRALTHAVLAMYEVATEADE